MIETIILLQKVFWSVRIQTKMDFAELMVITGNCQHVPSEVILLFLSF